MSGQLILSGGSTERDVVFKKSEVTHLRLILAWMRCEYMLDEDIQHGFSSSVKWMLENGHITEEQARTSLARKADEIRRVPLYVRQGVKMLTRMLREHEKRGDIVDSSCVVQKAIK